MQKIKIHLLTLLIIFLYVFATGAHASTMDVFLYPENGNIFSAETGIDIMIDPREGEFVGMGVNLSYTGPIEYVGITNNESINGCTVTEGSISGSEFALFCLIYGSPYTGDAAVFATINFIATGNGAASINIDSADIDFFTAETRGGDYTAVASVNGGDDNNEDEEQEEQQPEEEEEEEEEEDEDELPDTAIPGFIYPFAGISLLIISIALFVQPQSRLVNIKLNKDSNMRNKLFD